MDRSRYYPGIREYQHSEFDIGENNLDINLPGSSRDQFLSSRHDSHSLQHLELVNAILKKERKTFSKYFNYPDDTCSDKDFQECNDERTGVKRKQKYVNVDYELSMDNEKLPFESYMERIKEHLNRSHTVRIIEKCTYEKNGQKKLFQGVLNKLKQDSHNLRTFMQVVKNSSISTLKEENGPQKDLLYANGKNASTTNEGKEILSGSNLSSYMPEESSDSDHSASEETDNMLAFDKRKPMQKKFKGVKTRRLLPDKVAIKQKSLIYGFGAQVRQLSKDLEQFHKKRFPVGLSPRDRLLWLQENRDTGIWVQCSDCSKWRYLYRVKDALEIKPFWVCSMNSDFDFNKCSIPQAASFDPKDLIDADYSPGSVVLAKVKGFPWWPAIVDDNPECEQFYWLKETSNEVSFYHVVFFDSRKKCTNAWVDLDSIRPYIETFMLCFPLSRNNNCLYKRRLKFAKIEAEKALKMECADRLLNFGFLARFKESTINYKSENSQL
ncbi:zinc finger CW-type PWWP domain protein 1-like [Cimex lectularius]|uniref:Uncharacterized protein n=1 Tax=Cimex lectularius TaxID=79782 RepID=A0A8I6RA04_CIMLE|nr:zinc finger CW-type PWWP domain protein 1-like [Cimex lectularius]